MCFASVTSKPTNCSWPSLAVSTNSIGAKSGERATFSTGVSSLALALLSAALLAQAMQLSIIISASAITIIFFIIYILLKI